MTLWCDSGDIGPTDTMQLYCKITNFTSPFSIGVVRNCLQRDKLESRVVFQADDIVLGGRSIRMKSLQWVAFCVLVKTVSHNLQFAGTLNLYKWLEM